MKSSNPARRLHAILIEGKKIGLDVKCQSAWGKLLSAEPNTPDILRKLAKVMMLPGQVMEIMRREVPSQLDAQKNWLSPITVAFRAQNLSENWNTFIKHVSDPAVDFLGMTSEIIDMKVPSKEFDNERLSSLRAKLSEILGEIDQEEIPEKVRSYLHISIRKIIIAIDEFKLSGEEEIIEAVELAMGHAFFDKDYREVMSETEVGKKLFDIFNQIAVIVTLSTGIPAIFGGLTNLISSS